MTLLQKIQNLKWTPDLPYKIKEILLDIFGITQSLDTRIDVLESNTGGGDFIPLPGTEVGKPVTGGIEIETDFNLDYIQYPLIIKNKSNINNNIAFSSYISPGQPYPAIFFKYNDKRSFITYDDLNLTIGVDWDNQSVNSGTVLLKGLVNGTHDFSSRYTLNSYIQKAYVDNPQTLINALNNCDSTQLATIKGILGII